MVDDQLIEFKGVSKVFGGNVVLDSVDLVIAEGKITGIIAPSGQGKSTILKLLVGFYKPSSGEVFYLRRNIFKEMIDIEKYFGIATEDGSFYEMLTVKENLFYFARMYGLPKKTIEERYDEIIKLVDLEAAAGTLAQNLSIGMKKRLDVACSLIHNPLVLIMDEPTADLDPLLREHMLKLIKEINKRGTTVILTSQLIEELDRLCDNVAILFNKKIISCDSVSSIKKSYKTDSLNEVFRKVFSKAESQSKALDVKDDKNKKRAQSKTMKAKEEKKPEKKGNSLELEKNSEAEKLREAINLIPEEDQW